MAGGAEEAEKKAKKKSSGEKGEKSSKDKAAKPVKEKSSKEKSSSSTDKAPKLSKDGQIKAAAAPTAVIKDKRSKDAAKDKASSAKPTSAPAKKPAKVKPNKDLPLPTKGGDYLADYDLPSSSSEDEEGPDKRATGDEEITHVPQVSGGGDGWLSVLDSC